MTEKTANLAVMFVDLAGYTKRTCAQTYEQNAQMLQRFNAIMHPVVRCFGGRVVKEIGDAVLAVFSSPTRAVEAAMAMQDRVAEENRPLAAVDQLQIRVAINVGEVRIKRGDVFGEAVNVAARMESTVPVNRIYISGATYLTMNRTGLAVTAMATRDFKGVAEPVELFEVERSPQPATAQDGQRTGDEALPYGGGQLLQLRRQRNRQRYLHRSAIGAALVAAGLALFAGINLHNAAQRRTALQQAFAEGSLQEVAARTFDIVAHEELRAGQIDALLDALADANAPAQACEVIERLLLEAPTKLASAQQARMTRARINYSSALVFEGELARATACLPDAQQVDSSIMRRLAKLAHLHINAMTALRARNREALHGALQAYELFLRDGLPDARHLAFIGEIAADSFAYRNTRPIADSLIAEFLRERAAGHLVRYILQDTTPVAARSWAVARLEDVAEHAAVQWLSVYAKQLETGSCKTRRATIESLRRLDHVGAVGVLMREAYRGDSCTATVARRAADALIRYGTIDVQSAAPTPVLSAAAFER